MNFISLDFETANYHHDSEISIWLVKFENGLKTKFDEFINHLYIIKYLAYFFIDEVIA